MNPLPIEPGLRSSSLLPRAYWCHADRVTLSPSGLLLPDLTAATPGEAIGWMRERVREVSFLLDRETFHRVWAWLGDHRAMSTAITALRRGHPYAFALNTRTTQWTWTAYPVSELPVLPHPPGHPRHEHPGAPSPAPSTVTT